jgi:hypothetical protein
MNSRIRTGAIAVTIFFVASLNLGAQAALPASQEYITPVSKPDSRTDWTVTISTSGGFSSEGRGTFSVTSAGVFTCSSTTPCNRQIQKPALQSLESFVNSANLPSALQISDRNLRIPIQPSPNVCADCIVTALSLRIRDSKGIEWSYTMSWDVTTQSNVPIDFIRIYRAVAELAK